MKKLLIATGIISALVMTGCATTTTDTSMDNTSYTHGHGYHGQGDYHADGDSFTATYKCDHNATVSALYNPSAENSVLTITAPTLKLNGTQITAQLAPSGSGMRFVNQPSEDTKYDWHTKGTFGALDITMKGKTHSFRCNGSMPMHDH